MERPSSQPANYKPYENGALPPRMMPMPPQVAHQAQSQDEWNVRRIVGMVRRRAWVIIGVAAVVIPWNVWNVMNRQTEYQGSFQLLVEPVNVENENLANPTSTANSGSNQSKLDYETQIAVLTSPELMTKVVRELQDTNPAANYGSLLSRLEIYRVGETKVIEVKLTGDNSSDVQLALEELSKVYLQYSLNERQTYLRQGIQFVNQQLPTLQEQVDQLQDRLQAFRQRSGFIDPDSRATELTSQMATLDQQRLEAEQALVTARTYMNTLQDEGGMLVTLEKAPNYQQVVSQLQQIETEIATELTRFREDSLEIKTLRRKRDNLLPLLRQEAEKYLGTRMTEATIQIQTLTIQLRAIEQAKAKLQQQIQKLPILSREYANLQQQVTIASQSLNRFLETRQSLQVEAAQREIPWQLIKEPKDSVYPLAFSTGRSLIMGVLMGVALGIGAALLLEKLDNTYHAVEDFKDKLKLPVLGVLPFNPQIVQQQNLERRRRRKRKLLSQVISWTVKLVTQTSKSLNFLTLIWLDEYDSSTEFMESLRVLNTNLQIIGGARSLRSLVVSSAASRDGKSTVALHLAQTAVIMGQRVLLIDADLRRPQLHLQLNLSNEKGLSNVLSQGLELDNAIQKVDFNTELYVLTAGQSSPDPASLLSSQHMKHLIEQTHHLFDLVIYDTAPAVGLADASLIARFADGLALVVRLSQTNSLVLKQAIEDLKALQIPLLGLIVNGQRSYNPALAESLLPPKEPPNTPDPHTDETSQSHRFPAAHQELHQHLPDLRL